MASRIETTDLKGGAESPREKSKRIGSLAALLPFVGRYQGLLWAAAIALVLTAALALALPFAVRRVVDGFESGSVAVLDSYFRLAIGLTCLLALGTGSRYYLVTRLGERVVADLRLSVFNRMLQMSPEFYERIQTGEVLSRITTDTTLLLSVISSSISVAMRNILILTGGLGLMLWTSPKLTAAALMIVPLVVAPIIVLGRRLRRLSRENQDWIAKSSGMASELLLAAQTVQTFTQEAAAAARFRHATEKSYGAALKRVTTRALLTVIVIGLVAAAVVGVLWIGASDVRAGEITTGTLIQFLIYAIMVAGSVGALSEIWGELQRASGATERLFELLEADDRISDPSHPKALPAYGRGAIRFDRVSFTYPNRPETKALNEVSFEVEPGSTVAIVGPSGAGKSTIFQLLMRFYLPSSGQVSLDGVDVTEATAEDLRTAMSVVPQEPVIFAASARDNIRFGRPGASDAEVEAAAKAAAAHEFLTALPDGYGTYVGERGVMLSGGQKQRLALARAILRDASVLLLDEATSALDAESEHAVQIAVNELAKQRTTLIIAHRLATVKQADRILVFDEGRIVAEGTHDDLIEQDGLYARLARLQFVKAGTDVT